MGIFCLSITDRRTSKELYYSIKNKGAFRRFGIEDYWYQYRDEAIKQIAIDWCNKNGIAFAISSNN